MTVPTPLLSVLSGYRATCKHKPKINDKTYPATGRSTVSRASCQAGSPQQSDL